MIAELIGRLAALAPRSLRGPVNHLELDHLPEHYRRDLGLTVLDRSSAPDYIRDRNRMIHGLF